jgi:hypothetical protein
MYYLENAAGSTYYTLHQWFSTFFRLRHILIQNLFLRHTVFLHAQFITLSGLEKPPQFWIVRN